MDKINFQNLPSTSTPVNATNLNLLQTNVETAINGIIESGSNTNGHYIKYADGTLICYVKKSVGFDFASNRKWGSMWESTGSSLGTFPYTFYSTPIVSVSPNTSSGGFIEAFQDTSTTDIGTMYMCRPLDPGSSTTYTYQIAVIAIGRWKA